ncbi:hypothetical protein DV26_02280 [Amycolatopsis mediterranei]|uniref:Uncharacterized protein n=1 Tax=Amycolatopsis mediterranei (strain S699) TaxID=713604 RepID=A0A9R0P0Q0_AMYMS|nr:hypothetical protein RAM_28350 [Amycolatopsis mediterranei S699]KDO12494.1 hypothetical protein DV26_02280 [Amycolatopsis mediterranei]KDU88564.1 hypothetical protein DV36_30070 [Amycolatopsis mediterranei]
MNIAASAVSSTRLVCPGAVSGQSLGCSHSFTALQAVSNHVRGPAERTSSAISAPQRRRIAGG